MTQRIDNDENRKAEWKADRASLKAISCGGNECEDALKDLWKRHAGWLGVVARGQLFITGLASGSQMQPEDVVQEVFLKLLRSADAVRADYGLRPWFKMVARNLIVDYARKGGDREVSALCGSIHDQDPPGDYPDRVDTGAKTPFDSEYGLAECVELAFAAFERDHPEPAKTLRQVVWEERTIQELAIRLGRTPGATREYISQCRQRLRPYLERCREYIA